MDDSGQENSLSGSSRLSVRVRSTTDDPRIIAKAIAAAARQHGVEDLVLKSLQPKLTFKFVVPDAAMKDLLNESKKEYASQIGVIYRNVRRWLNHRRKVDKSLVYKASHPSLTPDDIEELRALVRAHFDQGAVIGADILRIWEEAGFEPADWGFMLTYYQEAFFLGRTASIENIDMPLDVLRMEMKKRPRTRLDDLALGAGIDNDRRYLRKIAESISDDVGGIVAAHEARQIGGVVNEYLAGNLKQTKHSPAGGGALNEEEREAIQADRWVDSERELQRELYHYFKDDPKNRDRDWWRVAVTETRAANNIARMITSAEDGFEEIYFLVQPDACKACRDAYLNPDGSPKTFKTTLIIERAISTNGVNIGADNRGLANATVHPHCQCIPLPVIPGVLPLRAAA